MIKTIIRRLLIMIPELIILSILVFILAKAMPGDPFTGLLTPQTSAAQIHRLKVQAGLYDPWYIQYFRWVAKMFHGDLGMSYQFKSAVSDLIAERAVNTLWLSLLTVILSYALAIPLGVIAGRYENSKRDKFIQLYSFIVYAIPAFVVYLLGVYFFGYKLHWFPTSGSVSVSANVGFSYVVSRFQHMLLPALLMSLISTTSVVQYLRSEIIDNSKQDYVKTVRAKGISERAVFTRHILRNSLLPIAAFFGYSITGLLGGSIFVETIFGYPGMGLLFMDSIVSRDYSVITALVMLYGTLNLLGTLLSDIILSIVDPRIRIE